MIKANRIRWILLSFALAYGITEADVPDETQTTSLNFERLSSLEKPFATQIGNFTVAASGVLDIALNRDRENKNSSTDFTGNFQINALTQLPNRWHLGLSYFGQYTDRDNLDSGLSTDSDYVDNASISIGSYWGRFLAGNVSGVVREQTRRFRGAGNADLEFDNFLGELDERGGGYVGRFGPWVFSSVVDDESHYDFGAVYQRPYGTRDYRLTLRLNKGTYISPNGADQYSTRGIGIVGELVYGSTVFDCGVGRENFSIARTSVERRYASVGVRKKFGQLSFSLEGHSGQIANNKERSTAIGIQYDIARGLSANLGFNQSKAKATVNDHAFIDNNDSSSTASIRYSF